MPEALLLAFKLWIGLGGIIAASTDLGTRLGQKKIPASLGFRLLIFPSLALLWPLFLIGKRKVQSP